MTDSPTLFMLLLGCKPEGRATEQHDVFFGIAGDLKSLVPQIRTYWPDGGEKLHIEDILLRADKERYELQLIHDVSRPPDPVTLGYFQLHKL